jgi:hypothetical protein
MEITLTFGRVKVTMGIFDYQEFMELNKIIYNRKNKEWEEKNEVL